jgi:S1-C subfamily serine protease
MSSRLLLLLTVLALLVAAGAVYRSATEQGPDGLAKTAVAAPGHVPGDEPVAQVAAEVEPSVVQVNVSGIERTPFGTQKQEGIGSGVIYRSDGYIITNNHVVEGARTVEVAFADGTTEQGEVVGTDQITDLAVIKVNRDGLPAASFSDDKQLAVGQLTVAIGSPSGFQSTVTSGVLSGMGREFPPELTGGQQESSLVDLLQTDAPISPGNSGGALADRDGQVIGINVAYLPPNETGAEGIGFAIPSYTVVSVADQLIKSGEAQHPYLGVAVSDLTPQVSNRFGVSAESGALIAKVEPGGPADGAGIRAGDVVTGLDSTDIRSSGDLLSALRQYQPGDKVELTILRDSQESTFDLRLGER